MASGHIMTLAGSRRREGDHFLGHSWIGALIAPGPRTT
ncbi:hypothetical protein L842_0699 [Mycobacterium intracellulare MIN_052511_1280]|nr:hypothetical protein L842_0699 [Mycobacterium intracellulare MIN_052511_1280]